MSNTYERYPPTFYDKTNSPIFWEQPSTTAIPEPKVVKSKLCPFRKRIYAMASNTEHTFNTYLGHAEFFEEEFLPCLGEECMFYRTNGESCGRK